MRSTRDLDAVSWDQGLHRWYRNFLISTGTKLDTFCKVKRPLKTELQMARSPNNRQRKLRNSLYFILWQQACKNRQKRMVQLSINSGEFHSFISLTQPARANLSYWREVLPICVLYMLTIHIHTNFKFISIYEISLQFFCLI